MSETFSVLIPTFNLKESVQNALTSVEAQTRPPDEVYVIDDGSTDGTQKALATWSNRFKTFKVLSQNHQGPGAARNLGLKNASGTWVSFLDADDSWEPQKLERVAQSVETDPEVSVVGHNLTSISPDGSEKLIELHRRFNPSHDLFVQLFCGNFFLTSCMSLRRKSLLKAGGFDPKLPSSQDYDLWLRFARQNPKGIFIPESLTRYTLRPGSISTRLWNRYHCMQRIAFRHWPEIFSRTGWFKGGILGIRFEVAIHWGLLQHYFQNRRLSKESGQ